jgi:formamidopyrimidine-DNA glycosylase
MPELPEVETMCRGIRPIVGCRVLSVARPPCRRRAISIQPRVDRFRSRAAGKVVVAVRRAGKRVVVWLADDQPSIDREIPRKAQGRPSLGFPGNAAQLPGQEAIVFEPRMTGLVLLSEPPTREHLRFQIRLAGGPRRTATGEPSRPQSRSTAHRDLLFWDRRGLGSVQLFSADEFVARFLENSKTLGPDALEVSAEDLRSRLGRSRRMIKVALLDQKAVAGIGNLYASEILHVARVHPAARCQRLKPAQWERIHGALRDVLLEAIRYEGSTLADGTYRNALNESGRYQNHHRVYDRAGVACRSCGRGTIRRIVQAQRSTFFCSECQRR